MSSGERDDQSAVNRTNALAVTISPLFGTAANVVTARSISPSSRTSTGLTSTAERRRHGLDCAEQPGPGGRGGVANDAHPRHARRDLFEQLKPFAAQAILERVKPVMLPPGRARLSTKPAPTGSTTCTNTIGYRAGSLQQRRHRSAADG